MLGLQYAGSSWLHESNEYGICKHCGRLREEIKAGYYSCHRTKGISFKNSEYLKAPRHPLFLDCVKVIRDCGYCSRSRSGFCKKHNDLRRFLESEKRQSKHITQESKSENK